MPACPDDLITLFTLHVPGKVLRCPEIDSAAETLFLLICRVGEVCSTDASSDEQPRRFTAAAAHCSQRRERPQALQAS